MFKKKTAFTNQKCKEFGIVYAPKRTYHEFVYARQVDPNQ